jgi:hypothetical protein
MSLIKKSDVKNHLSPRFRTQIHVSQPEGEPVATDFSAAAPSASSIDSAGFARDFLGEHSSSGVKLAPVKPLVEPVSPPPAEAPKSARM